ncbi:MAG TPA: sigma-54 dependent transcriptional regulator, partial [Anaeromyxobacteraceae bacterium]|nr:sigma-54 dependent transcriptional regulator [Anaeromyxobacteraceae bacterium]
MKDRVLIVDDEADGREALAELTARWGYDVLAAADGTEALRKAIEWHPDIILTDLVMPNMDGLWLLRALRAELPDCPVVLLTGRGSIQLAVQAIKEGAWDFIEKPLEPSRLRIVVERALDKKETMREVQLLRRRLAALAPGTDMVGSGPAMQRVFELVKKVAASNASVVIGGESGTGKEVVARAIHGLSPRRDKPFVALNCSAIPAGLIEAELFGAERGAFTGADQRRLGCFELAHNGTLFLDEIGELPMELQAKFLRVLEERKFRRLGGRVEVEVDVRVLCATNRDLKEEIRRGRFREDLFFRLGVFGIPLPPLKERREDVPLLVHHFIEKFNAETGKRVQGVSPAAMEILQGYAWP